MTGDGRQLFKSLIANVLVCFARGWNMLQCYHHGIVTERIRDTLIHEMCHAAVWIINETQDGHGRYASL